MYGDIRPSLFVCHIIRDLIILQLGVLHNWVIIDDERSDQKNKENADSCAAQCTFRPLIFLHSVLSGWASVWIFKLRNFRLVSLGSFVNQSISAYHSTVSLCYIMDFIVKLVSESLKITTIFWFIQYCIALSFRK